MASGEAEGVGAIVLAAGAGRRFGGPKQLAEVGGEAMVAAVVRAAVSCDGLASVTVVVGAHVDEVEAALPGVGERVLRCAAWEAGLGASLACGLAGAGDLDRALILLGDQPLVDAALIDAVLAEGLPKLATGRYDAARAVGPDGAPGHPVLLGPAAIAACEGLTGEAGVLGRLDRARVWPVATSGSAATFDIDVPGDLVVARAMLAAPVDSPARALAGDGALGAGGRS